MGGVIILQFTVSSVTVDTQLHYLSLLSHMLNRNE